MENQNNLMKEIIEMKARIEALEVANKKHINAENNLLISL